jgi:hypothetical protein
MFTGIAALVKYEDRKRLLTESIDFLLSTLKIPLENIRINIGSKDSDLIDMLRELNCPIELVFDSKPSVYYTHKY